MEALTFDGTRKLYYEDAYAVNFDAQVVSAEKPVSEGGAGEDSLWRVILDQTLFFPEEGGQSPDKGVLEGFEVVDVQIRSGVIEHTVRVPSGNCEKAGASPEESLPFTPGMSVSGRIDWSRRFSNMQQHSGEHLFSGIAHTRFGCENVGFHLSDSEVTLDFDKALSEEQIEQVEAAVNEAITANVESRILYPTKAEEAGMDFRSKIEISGQTRLVEFPGYDLCACCAPHVRRTGEIGLLKVMSVQNYKGGVRVSILCGKRALAELCREHRLITGLGRSLSTSTDEVPAQVIRFKEEIASLKTELAASQSELLAMKARALPENAGRVALFAGAADMKVARDLVNDLMTAHSEMAAVFIGNDTDGYSFVIGSADGKANEICGILREAFGARGGGKPVMAQGSVQASEAAIREQLL